MSGSGTGVAACGGMIGAVGRTATTLALLDQRMRLRADTVRSVSADQEPMVTGAILRFMGEFGIGGPMPTALAVAGVVRGETVPITNSRRFVSRRGLTDLLRVPPVLINDFAAQAWALAGGQGVTVTPICGSASPSSAEGTRCLVGIGDALGVVAYVVDQANRTTVLATEAGASALSQGMLTADERRSLGGEGRVQLDALFSAPGLLSLYRAACARSGAQPHARDGYAVARSGSAARADQASAEAVARFSRALLAYLADLALTYGAWDGIYLTGQLAALLGQPLAEAARTGALATPGPHSRRLAGLAVGAARFDQGELAGAAMALAHARGPVGP